RPGLQLGDRDTALLQPGKQLRRGGLHDLHARTHGSSRTHIQSSPGQARSEGIPSWTTFPTPPRRAAPPLFLASRAGPRKGSAPPFPCCPGWASKRGRPPSLLPSSYFGRLGPFDAASWDRFSKPPPFGAPCQEADTNDCSLSGCFPGCRLESQPPLSAPALFEL